MRTNMILFALAYALTAAVAAFPASQQLPRSQTTQEGGRAAASAPAMLQVRSYNDFLNVITGLTQTCEECLKGCKANPPANDFVVGAPGSEEKNVEIAAACKSKCYSGIMNSGIWKYCETPEEADTEWKKLVVQVGTSSDGTTTQKAAAAAQGQVPSPVTTLIPAV